MSKPDHAYELTKEESVDSLQFFFISRGQQDVIKAVQYSFIQIYLLGKAVYNLGFGDYTIEDDSITDNVNSNNGDAYRVFNTVLNTIPIFFDKYSNGILMAQGSDSKAGFADDCHTTCIKNCTDECKNLNRRINVYRGYINKNYEHLCISYEFLGGTTDEEQTTIVESYQCGKKYDSVFLFKKSS